MKILSSSDQNRNEILEEALAVLRRGGIVAYPTESFYALGVMALDEKAVGKLFTLKQRPAAKPLPVIVGHISTLRQVVKGIPEQAESLINKYWPGPLTLVFEARSIIPTLLTGRQNRLAARIPGQSMALHLAQAADFLITATSANISAKPPSEDAESIVNYFSDAIDLIIDGGRTPGGKPSTIVDTTVDPPVVLRQGSILLDVSNLKG